MSETYIGTFDPVKTLQDLLGDDPSAAGKKAVAKFLSRIGDHSPPWSVGYIENIVAGRQEPGAPIASALRAVWIHKNGGPPIVGAFAPVQVRARSDAVETGSLVLGRSTRCSECNYPIVPKTPNGKTCSDICAGIRKIRLARERRTKRRKEGK